MKKSNRQLAGKNRYNLFNATALAGICLLFSVTVIGQQAKGGKKASMFVTMWRFGGVAQLVRAVES